MKKMNKLTVAAAALLALGLASTAASAQTVSVVNGDVILGFELTGASSDYEVDLGSASLFTTTATLNLSSKLDTADLIAAFGSGWADTTNGVMWGAAAYTATTGANKNNLDLTSTTDAAPHGTNSLVNFAGGARDLGTGSAGGLNGQPAAGTSTSALVGNASAPANTLGNDWTEENANQFSGLNGTVEQVGAGSNDLFAYNGTGSGSVTDLGTLTLGSNGSLTFTGSAAATPEPSAYALGICAVLLFAVLRRRATVA